MFFADFYAFSQTIVLPPIQTSHLSTADVEDLTRTTRDLMLRELITLTNSPLGQQATRPTVEPAQEDLADLAMATGVQR